MIFVLRLISVIGHWSFGLRPSLVIGASHVIGHWSLYPKWLMMPAGPMTATANDARRANDSDSE